MWLTKLFFSKYLNICSKNILFTKINVTQLKFQISTIIFYMELSLKTTHCVSLASTTINNERQMFVRKVLDYHTLFGFKCCAAVLNQCSYCQHLSKQNTQMRACTNVCIPTVLSWLKYVFSHFFIYIVSLLQNPI